MTLTVSKWGNSLGIRIPKHVTEELHLHEGSSLTLEPHPDGYILKPSDTPMISYLLGDLVASKLREPQESELEWGAPAGDEVW